MQLYRAFSLTHNAILPGTHSWVRNSLNTPMDCELSAKQRTRKKKHAFIIAVLHKRTGQSLNWHTSSRNAIADPAATAAIFIRYPLIIWNAAFPPRSQDSRGDTGQVSEKYRSVECRSIGDGLWSVGVSFIQNQSNWKLNSPLECYFNFRFVHDIHFVLLNWYHKDWLFSINWIHPRFGSKPRISRNRNGIKDVWPSYLETVARQLIPQQFRPFVNSGDGWRGWGGGRRRKADDVISPEYVAQLVFRGNGRTNK